ncbi:MAG: hypothetical protein JNK05_28345 [Myxococcales bacterium]|nr:hypothetical protein [Myxococcales bacterium]
MRMHSARTLLAVTLSLALARCDKPTPQTQGPATTPEPARPAVVDAQTPSARVLARHVVTFYRWRSTEPGNAETRGESIEHGIQKVHFVIEVHRDEAGKHSLRVAGLSGDTTVPQQVRMRSEGPSSATYNVPREGFAKYSLENFGGELRNGEPIRVLLSSAPAAREALSVTNSPAFTRLPAAGEITGGSAPQIGQVDAVVVFVVPVVSRRGGRYLVHAVDMNAEPGGFAANGVLTHNPSDSEITRYVAWMRDRNGMGRDRNPPIAMHPIDRS